MYKLRSIIAHGGPSGPSDFAKDPLRDLHDMESVFKFVRDAVKKLIIHAMYYPQFVYDLKAC